MRIIINVVVYVFFVKFFVNVRIIINVVIYVCIIIQVNMLNTRYIFTWDMKLDDHN